MSEPVYVHAVPFALVRRARHEKEAAAYVREAVRAAGLKSFPSLERFFEGKDIGEPAETVSVLEVLARAVGRRLPSTLGGGVTVRLMDRVDAALVAAGLPKNFEMTQLVFGGSLVDGLPFPPEKPSVGYIEPELVVQAMAQFADEAPTSDDSNVDEVLSQIEDWLTLVRRWQPDFSAPLGLFGTWA